MLGFFLANFPKTAAENLAGKTFPLTQRPSLP